MVDRFKLDDIKREFVRLENRVLATANRVMDSEELLEMYERADVGTDLVPTTATWEDYTPYDFQRNLIDQTATHREVFLMAANQIGKSHGSTYFDACHLTGNYPDWWEGRRFDHPITMLCMGLTSEQCRDVLQVKLVGTCWGDRPEGGWVHQDRITGIIRSTNVRGHVRDVMIRHVSGGTSWLMFRQASQGAEVLQGLTIDLVHMDEEPEHGAMELYQQAATRLVYGDNGRGGMMLITATPENGRTPLVIRFMDSPAKHQVLIRATWDDCEHLTSEAKEALLGSLEPWQRKLRSMGIPVRAQGLVYQVDLDGLLYDPDAEPITRAQRVIGACDLGMSHATVFLYASYDLDTDVVRIFDGTGDSDKLPEEHADKLRAMGRERIPIIFPHDAESRERGSGKTMSTLYEECGVRMWRKFENAAEAESNFVEPGILTVLDRMRTGRLKISNKLIKLQQELRDYHRDDLGKIVKHRDDWCDALRYVVNSVQHAETLKHWTTDQWFNLRTDPKDYGLEQDDWRPKQAMYE